MGRGFFSLLGGGLTALLALFCGAASAQAPAEDEAPVAIDATHTMQPKGFTWVLKDTTSGKEQILILPAFHPTQSKPLLMGDRLAYASITKRGEKSQLGCVTFDLSQGKVLNRQDTDIFVDEGAMPDAQVSRGDDGHVTCHFAGQQCLGKNQEKCSVGEDAVRLSFNGGEQARQGLAMHCKKPRKGKKKVCTPVSAEPSASAHGKHGKGAASAKSGNRGKHGKAAATGKGKKSSATSSRASSHKPGKSTASTSHKKKGRKS